MAESPRSRKHSIKAKLRKIVNNCTIFEKERRPRFDDVVEYIERIERQPSVEAPSMVVNKVNDFLVTL